MEKDCQHSKLIRCDRTDCTSCGWDPQEIARRKTIIRNDGLQYGEDGLKRLYLGFKKEESIEDADRDL